MSLYFEDFYPGLKWQTASRTVTAKDIETFCDLFGDRNPLHIDEEYAKAKGYPGIIAHGPFRISLITGLTSQIGTFNDTNFGVVDMRWKWHKPVCVGDTIHVDLEVIECIPTSKPTRGIIRREYRAINQRDEVVETGTMWIMVMARGDGSGPANKAEAKAEI